ncbi:hypothetical protein [Brunnivagina elsteri]|uniref:hypothetical protein n=1 Tax=Brunnivagina elsteri TaxID=1247191 RepID=UPI001FE3A6E6|nr:hypothetical protein [Calothrix elsteri]
MTEAVNDSEQFVYDIYSKSFFKKGIEFLFDAFTLLNLEFQLTLLLVGDFFEEEKEYRSIAATTFFSCVPHGARRGSAFD